MRAFEQPLTGCLWWGGHSLVCSNDCAQTKQMLIIVSKLHKSQCQQEVWSNPAPLFFPFSLTLEVMLMLDRVRASRAGQMTTLGPSKCIILLDSSFPNWTLHCLDLPECSFIMSVSCVCMCGAERSGMFVKIITLLSVEILQHKEVQDCKPYCY